MTITSIWLNYWGAGGLVCGTADISADHQIPQLKNNLLSYQTSTFNPTFDTPMESHTSSSNTPPPADTSSPHHADDTPCTFSPGTDSVTQADNPVPCPHQFPEPEEPTQEAWVRRSTRAQTKTRFYDAASGKGDVAHS